MNATAIKQTGLCNHQRSTVKGNADQMNPTKISIGFICSDATFMIYPKVNAIFSAWGSVGS